MSEFADDVRRGLTRPGHKSLPPKYFYDAVGSALFEAITHLPEYGLTRADERLLCRHASDLAAALPEPVLVAELGSGTGTKTRHILAALRDLTAYYPIDLSATALARCADELNPYTRVEPLEMSYLDGLAAVPRAASHRLLLLFLGSTIGNFDPASRQDFLRSVRSRLHPGDALLLGADLVKPEAQILAAYDDPVGVTAAFNRNVLARINRELGANFDLRLFTHEARWNDEARRIEMHLRCQRDTIVSIPGAACEVSFSAGETIWTESSYKFAQAELDTLARDCGFLTQAQWIDSAWPFAECLWRAA